MDGGDVRYQQLLFDYKTKRNIIQYTAVHFCYVSLTFVSYLFILLYYIVFSTDTDFALGRIVPACARCHVPHVRYWADTRALTCHTCGTTLTRAPSRATYAVLR